MTWIVLVLQETVLKRRMRIKLNVKNEERLVTVIPMIEHGKTPYTLSLQWCMPPTLSESRHHRGRSVCFYVCFRLSVFTQLCLFPSFTSDLRLHQQRIQYGKSQHLSNQFLRERSIERVLKETT